MNGISLMMPISCCPVYNLGTSNNINLNPRRLSNLHLQIISPTPPPLATTPRMLKHRVDSASSSDQDATWLRPEVSATVVPYGLFGLGISGLTLLKAGEVVVQLISSRGGVKGNSKSNTRYGIITRVVISLVARSVVGKIQDWLSLKISPPFSIGDVIKVGSVEGRVIEIGPLNTSLRSAEGTTIVVKNSLFSSQAIFNKSRDLWHAVVSKIYVQADGIGKINAISEEIKNMMKSNSNVYLEEEQVYCWVSRLELHYAELTLEYKLKQMSEDKLKLAKHDILMQSTQIIMKHGATLA